MSGLPYAAGKVGVGATIVMPQSAVVAKIEATRSYGGELILTEGNVLEVAREIERTRKMTFVHPFDDLAVIAGLGTVGLEILEDVPDVDVSGSSSSVRGLSSTSPPTQATPNIPIEAAAPSVVAASSTAARTLGG